MALHLRRLPEPVDWVAPSADALPPAAEPVCRSALRLCMDSGSGPFAPAGAGEGRPVVAVRTAASTGSGAEAVVRWAGTPDGVRAAVRVFPSAARVTFDRAAAMARALARDLGVPVSRLDPEHHALLCFGAGGDGAASLVATALAQAAPGVPMVGGTFAGGVGFDGTIRAGGAVVALVASEAPLRAFEAHPFSITDQRTVVTACDDTGLVVRELDGFPAAERLDRLGVPAGCLDGPPDRVLAALDTQLAWVVRGRMLLRPIAGRRGTALTVGSPVQPGLVLRVVQRVENPAEALLRQVDQALSALAAPAAAAWAFACRSLLLGEPGLALREGLARMGVVACAANGAFHGPVHSSGMLAGLVYGDVGR